MSQKDYLWPKGLKKTKHRQALMDLFQKENRPLSVVEIQQLLHDEKNPIWLSTIYRVLESFENYNLVNKISLLNQDAVFYELNLNQHVHYAICVKCRKVIELEHCPMGLFEETLNKQDFVITGHRMEIYGHCKQCHISI